MTDKESRALVLQSAYATLTRPTTAAVVRMLNKLAPFSTRSSKGKVRALDLQKFIEKVHKHQKKVDYANKALLKAFDIWGAELPTPENALVVREFSELLDCVNVVYSAQADRLNILKVHLGAISTREQRQTELLEKHNKLQKKFDSTAMKHGPKAAQTSLFLDQIEENEYNLKLIEQQLIRIALSSLKEGCTEYLLWLQGSVVSLTRSCNLFASTLRESEPRKFLANSGMSRGGPSLPEEEIERMVTEQRREEFQKEMQRELAQREREKYPDSKFQEARESPLLKEPREYDYAAYDIHRYERNQEGWG